LILIKLHIQAVGINTNNMKATIEYNLPDDQFEFDNAVKSNKMWHALTEIKDELRTIWKYEDLKENQYEMVERIREKFFEILTENEINLD
jgi:hypothetical protein